MIEVITKVIFNVLINISMILLVCAVSTLAVSSEKSDENSTTLELVAILHRHGLRAPTRTYPTDPYQENAWPVAWGQLLKEGKQQLYKLGKIFREHYKSFIFKYSPKTVKVRTSDFDRCHMSVASLLAGWFPPSNDEELWNKDLVWQPIPIHSVPTTQDNVLAQIKPCHRYNVEFHKVLEEIKSNETLEDKTFIKYLTENTGTNVTKLRQVAVIYGTLTMEKLYGFILPDWTKTVYPEEMRKRAKLSFASYQWNKLMRRLSAGPFINELLGQFKHKHRGKHKDLKLLLYSAHETTLSSVWSAFEFEDVLMPDFGASFIFELHKTDDQYNVRMFYLNNTEETQPHLLYIPNCPAPCSLDKLYDLTKDIRPVDWEKECAVDLEDDKK